ncbi:unnamed protein product [Somion occarium]|uniref:Uncharacterized protein n=1 Tax=Somion occarium TaxID=3059160 RepID=A0ABP1D7G8_9APHY
MNTYTHPPNATFFQYMDVPTGGQRPYAFTTRQWDDLERGVVLASEPMSDMFDQKNAQRQKFTKRATPACLVPEPLPIAAPKPMHPNAISPPLLTLQWKLTGDEFSTPPPSYNQLSPHGLAKETGSLAIASEKNQIIDVGKRAPQPPIGTGRPRPSNIRRRLASTAVSRSTSHSRWTANERAMALLAILNGHNSPVAAHKPSNQWVLDAGRSPYSSYDGPNANSVSSLHAYDKHIRQQSFPISAYEPQNPIYGPISAPRGVPSQSQRVHISRSAGRRRVGQDLWKSCTGEEHNEAMGIMGTVNNLSDGLSRDRPIIVHNTPRPVQYMKKSRPLPRPPIQAGITPLIVGFSGLRV